MQNEGVLDRIVRAILGLVFAYLAYAVFVGAMSVVFYVLAVLMLLTAASGFCMLYNVFGISTKNSKN